MKSIETLSDREADALLASMSIAGRLIRRELLALSDFDLGALREGLATLELICARTGDADGPAQFGASDLTWDYASDLRLHVTQEWARRRVADGHKLVITDECGDFKALITGIAEYRCPYGGNPAYRADYPDVVEPRGFRVVYADGREEVAESLYQYWQNYYGVGAGPWDGQDYTIELYDEDKHEASVAARAAARGMHAVQPHA
jgi:hypothetical protein